MKEVYLADATLEELEEEIVRRKNLRDDATINKIIGVINQVLLNNGYVCIAGNAYEQIVEVLRENENGQ